MTTKPGFVKYFLPRSCATQMLIPSPFMHCIGGSLPKKIFLHDRYYNLWRVKAAHIGQNWYFKNGWEKFVKDNKILPRDSLVFDYSEEDLFLIKILGPNGCETKGAGKLVSLDFDDETDEDDDDSEEVDRVLKWTEDLSEESEDSDDDEIDFSEEIADDDDDDDDEIEDVDYLSNKKLKVEKGLSEANEDDYEIDFSEENEDDDDETEDADYLSDKKIKVEQRLSKENEDNDNEIDEADYSPNQEIEVEQDLPEKSEDDNDTEDSEYLPNTDIIVEQVKNAAVGNAKRKSKTLPPQYPKYYGLEIFEKGLAKQPTNPYFVTTVKPTRTFDLFIPLPLIEDHNLDLPKPKMLLVDPHGREYHGKYKRWTDGRIMYAGEWKFLLRRNEVEIGDTCICEFKVGAKGLYLKASFLHIPVVADTSSS